MQRELVGAKPVGAADLAPLLNSVSARTHPRRCPEERGTKKRGPMGERRSGADRQLDTHLDALPNPPATQGSSSGSASAQNGGILERDFALAFCSSSCPPGGRGTWTQRGPLPPLSLAAPGLCCSRRDPRGWGGETGPAAGALAASGEVGAPWQGAPRLLCG